MLTSWKSKTKKLNLQGRMQKKQFFCHSELSLPLFAYWIYVQNQQEVHCKSANTLLPLSKRLIQNLVTELWAVEPTHVNCRVYVRVPNSPQPCDEDIDKASGDFARTFSVLCIYL